MKKDLHNINFIKNIHSVEKDIELWQFRAYLEQNIGL